MGSGLPPIGHPASGETAAAIIPNHRKTDNRHRSLLIVVGQSRVRNRARHDQRAVRIRFALWAARRSLYRFLGDCLFEASAKN